MAHAHPPESIRIRLTHVTGIDPYGPAPLVVESRPPPSAVLAPGARLNRYRILRTLGAGGMGEVYEAEDTRLKRRIALKILPDAIASDPARLARFEKEAQAIAALNHPNIVIIHSVEDDGERRFLTMELVEGPRLDA